MSFGLRRFRSLSSICSNKGKETPRDQDEKKDVSKQPPTPYLPQRLKPEQGRSLMETWSPVTVDDDEKSMKIEVTNDGVRKGSGVPSPRLPDNIK